MTPLFEIIPDGHGKLLLKRPGQDDVADVRLRRSFPWSSPEQFVSVRGKDGKELLLIDDLAAVSADQRQLIERWLAAVVFIPRITRVETVDVRFGHQQWVVRTDRGPIAFRVQEREDIRFLPDGRFSIKDADGNLYEMPPLEQLDPASCKAIEPLL